MASLTGELQRREAAARHEVDEPRGWASGWRGRRRGWAQRDRITLFTIASDMDTVPWELLYPVDHPREGGYSPRGTWSLTSS